jgi:hypothetical protein
MLLLKQDKLSILESQLEKVDKEERAALFLGSSRDDSNQERLRVLSNIDVSLAEYGINESALSDSCLLTKFR